MHQCQWRADRSGQPKEVCFSATPSPHHRKSHAVDRVLPEELSANCALEPRVGPWAAQEISRTWHGPLARLPRAAGNLARTALLRSQELLWLAGDTSAICTAHPETNGEPRHPRDLRTNRPLRDCGRIPLDPVWGRLGASRCHRRTPRNHHAQHDTGPIPITAADAHL